MTMQQEILLLAESSPIFRVSETSPEINPTSGH